MTERLFVSVADLVVEGQKGFRLEVPRFIVDRPGITAFIGRNGSGKSSFLDTLLNLVEPRGGSVDLFGARLAQLGADDPVRFAIGAQGGGMVWNYGIKVSEIMALHRDIYRTVDCHVIDRLGIAPLAPLLYRKLSTGQRRRTDLAVALAHQPRLIVLDEPTAGLDKGYQEALRALVAARAAAGAAVLMASHEAEDLALASRIVWFNGGRIVADGSAGELVSGYLGEHLCTLDGGRDPAARAVAERVSTAVAPLATFWRSADTSLVFAGGAAMRQRFLEAVEGAGASGFAVRSTGPGDLVTLLTTTSAEQRA